MLRPPCRLSLAGPAQEWEDAVADIPKLCVASGRSGVLRHTLAHGLPPFPVEQLLGLGLAHGMGAADAARHHWRAYLLLSFVAHVSARPCRKQQLTAA